MHQDTAVTHCKNHRSSKQKFQLDVVALDNLSWCLLAAAIWKHIIKSMNVQTTTLFEKNSSFFPQCDSVTNLSRQGLQHLLGEFQG